LIERWNVSIRLEKNDKCWNATRIPKIRTEVLFVKSSGSDLQNLLNLNNLNMLTRKNKKLGLKRKNSAKIKFIKLLKLLKFGPTPKRKN